MNPFVLRMCPRSPASEQAGPSPTPTAAARWRLRCLLVPIFLKILWLHCTCTQGRQFARLGRCRQTRAALPESWAHWASGRIGRFVFRIPIIQRRVCYWRSQMIFDILPRFGFPVLMHLGVLATDPTPDHGIAHLWVSLNGRVLGNPADSPGQYLELAAYSAEARRG